MYNTIQEILEKHWMKLKKELTIVAPKPMKKEEVERHEKINFYFYERIIYTPLYIFVIQHLHLYFPTHSFSFVYITFTRAL